GSSPVPFLIARSMLSFGMFAALALAMKVRSRGLNWGSPPFRAASVISFAIALKIFPRFASIAALCRLVVAHLLCPDIQGNWLVNYRKSAREGDFYRRGAQWESGLAFHPCRRF